MRPDAASLKRIAEPYSSKRDKSPTKFPMKYASVTSVAKAHSICKAPEFNSNLDVHVSLSTRILRSYHQVPTDIQNRQEHYISAHEIQYFPFWQTRNCFHGLLSL